MHVKFPDYFLKDFIQFWFVTLAGKHQDGHGQAVQKTQNVGEWPREGSRLLYLSTVIIFNMCIPECCCFTTQKTQISRSWGFAGKEENRVYTLYTLQPVVITYDKCTTQCRGQKIDVMLL